MPFKTNIKRCSGSEAYNIMSKSESVAAKDSKCHLIVLSLLLLFFAQFMIGGLYMDDANRWDLRAKAEMEGLNLYQLIVDVNEGWMSKKLFRPLAWAYYTFTQYVGQEVLTFRIITYIVNVAGYFVFYLLVRRLTGSLQLALYSLVFLLLCSKVQHYQEPFLCYAGLQTIQYLLYFGGPVFGILYLLEDKRIYLFLSCISVLFGLLMYELNLSVVGVLCMCALLMLKNRRAFLLLGSIAVIYVLYFVLRFYAFSLVEQQGTYAGPSFEPAAIVETYLKQIVSVIPLLSHVINAVIYTKPEYVFRFAFILPYALLLGLILCYVLYQASRIHTGSLQDMDHKRRRMIITMSVGLIIMPPALVSISGKYQETLVWGIGHPSFLLQCFGLSIILAYLFQTLKLRIPNSLYLPCCVLPLCLAMVYLVYGNRISITGFTNIWYNERYVIEQAFKKFTPTADFEEGQRIHPLESPVFSLNREEFYYRYTNKRLDVLHHNNLEAGDWVFYAEWFEPANAGSVVLGQFVDEKDGVYTLDNVQIDSFPGWHHLGMPDVDRSMAMQAFYRDHVIRESDNFIVFRL